MNRVGMDFGDMFDPEGSSFSAHSYQTGPPAIEVDSNAEPVSSAALTDKDHSGTGWMIETDPTRWCKPE